ncbi:solute:sodium symporter family transporter [Pseudoflavitalea sp. G-6-1-2]|uniref:solute:sodium symporter family transporter n=1 Tax=Pseudoflavitalea sp. G-6-1-2 TaxID=2728841 RepID=UPI00146F1F87|nr:solute:sodium symporter family transporter [Pseudoflavitalea sp. G-6-1-2]NML23844.1 solute:sodium symporter family transporter [Pseudoflavitalea sp. G-6-1-2]
MDRLALLTFIVITVAVAFFSWFMTRKEKLNTLSGFFFANRKLGFVSVGCGLLFANINTASFIGENELSFTNNMSVMAWGVSSVVAMLLVSEYIIPVYLKTGIATTPDFLEARYDKSVKTVVSLMFLLNYIISLLPSVLYGSAIAFDGLFGISEHFKADSWITLWVLVWIMGGLGALYALLGGLKAITVSETLLGFAMFTGGLLLPYFALKYLGSGDWHQGLQTVLTTKTEHLNSIGGAKDSIPFSTIFTGMLLVNLYYWGTEQYIVQQALGSKDLASSQKGIALAAFGKLLLPLLLNVPGVIAVHIYTSMENPAMVFSKLTGDVSPPVYSGYWGALLFGAALTTFNAGLNSSSTLFVFNIYKPLAIKNNWQNTEAACVRVAKRFEVLVCLLAMFIAPFIMFARGGFYTYLQKIGGFFSVPVFTILLIGMVTKRVPPLAAKFGLAFFIVCYGVTQLFFETGLHFLHILAILFLITCSLMLLIGRWKPMAVPYQLKLNNHVNIDPWKNRKIYAALLLLITILIYLVFSPWGLVRKN